MDTWKILLLITLAIIVICTIYVKRRKKVVSSGSAGLGVQIRHAAENIPIYGQVIKVAGVVGKPLNNILDKSVSVQINALQHIPVAGAVLAKPLEWSQQGVKKLNNWLGL